MHLNTKVLMIASAVLMGVVGILLSFLPQEIGALFGGVDAIILQLMGAVYFGWSMANWTAKASLMGGIYGRAIGIGNFAHFMIGAFALLKRANMDEPLMLGLAIVYILFAIFFGVVFFTHPKTQ